MLVFLSKPVEIHILRGSIGREALRRARLSFRGGWRRRKLSLMGALWGKEGGLFGVIPQRLGTEVLTGSTPWESAYCSEK